MPVTAIRLTSDDIPTLNAWMAAHNHPGRLGKGYIPEVGYWVPGVVSCFLYQTDTKVAYIDGFLSNPESKKEDRHAAMIEVGKSLCDEAAKRGFETLRGTTTYPSIAATAIACGFDVTEYNFTYMSKQLLKGHK